MDHLFLSFVGDFINCEIETLLFKYLGLPIRGNPRREFTWDPLANMMTRRL